VESGEGIERMLFSQERSGQLSPVESGEGIESLYCPSEKPKAEFRWNPVKELKDDLSLGIV